MKKFGILSLLLLLCLTSFAQSADSKSVSADLGMWGWIDGGELTTTSWNMFMVDNDLFEVRYSFDQENALSLYYGHSIFSKTWSSGNHFSFTPAIGFTTRSDFSAVGMTSHTMFETDRMKFYTINQYNLGASKVSTNIMYHWFDYTCWINDWLNVGASEQYYSSGDTENFDVGPSVGFEIGNLYGKVYAWDMHKPDDAYFGVWLGFYFSND